MSILKEAGHHCDMELYAWTGNSVLSIVRTEKGKKQRLIIAGVKVSHNNARPYKRREKLSR
jgi:hypothetical protein